MVKRRRGRRARRVVEAGSWLIRSAGLVVVLTYVLRADWALGDPIEEQPYYEVEDLLVGTSMHNPRDADWRPGDGITLEVTGLAMWDEDCLAVATRKGEVWKIRGIEGPAEAMRYTLFAEGLDEPLGLLRRGDRLLLTQRTEVTSLWDGDGDGVADVYETVAKGWHVGGNYHGYAYGPVEDGEGRLWVTLNLDMGSKAANDHPWRGWGVCLTESGGVTPMCAGMRSPCGLGRNAEGDVFFTDQQGQWIPTNNLHHLREGAYYGNPEGMAPAALPKSPVAPLAAEVEGEAYPEALRRLPQLVPPAVWFPYGKMGRSRTGIRLDDTAGRFGPFGGQLFIGEFTDSKVGRVYLEKVNGNYQGACFPFLEGFPCAVMQGVFSARGSFFVGMSNRGWSSLGSASYGLQRVRWTGRVPFEMAEMRAERDGFSLIFTREIDPASAARTTSYRMTSYTYPLHRAYGAPEIQTAEVEVISAEVMPGKKRVRLRCAGLRPYYVHELTYDGVRSEGGEEPWHGVAYYTLNHIPEAGATD